MNKVYCMPIILILCLISNLSKAQYISHYREKNRIEIDTLIDGTTGAKFILSNERIYITAIDKVGKVLWRTNPAIDNKLPEYRVKRPKIVYFAFQSDMQKGNREVIWIVYNNTQFGYLNKINGRFTYLGQD